MPTHRAIQPGREMCENPRFFFAEPVGRPSPLNKLSEKCVNNEQTFEPQPAAWLTAVRRRHTLEMHCFQRLRARRADIPRRLSALTFAGTAIAKLSVRRNVRVDLLS